MVEDRKRKAADEQAAKKPKTAPEKKPEKVPEAKAKAQPAKAPPAKAPPAKAPPAKDPKEAEGAVLQKKRLPSGIIYEVTGQETRSASSTAEGSQRAASSSTREPSTSDSER